MLPEQYGAAGSPLGTGKIKGQKSTKPILLLLTSLVQIAGEKVPIILSHWKWTTSLLCSAGGDYEVRTGGFSPEHPYRTLTSFIHALPRGLGKATVGKNIGRAELVRSHHNSSKTRGAAPPGGQRSSPRVSLGPHGHQRRDPRTEANGSAFPITGESLGTGASGRRPQSRVRTVPGFGDAWVTRVSLRVSSPSLGFSSDAAPGSSPSPAGTPRSAPRTVQPPGPPEGSTGTGYRSGAEPAEPHTS